MQNLVTRNDHFDWRLNLLGISAAMPQLCGFPSALLGARFDGPVTVIAGDELRLRARSAMARRSAPMFPQVEVERHRRRRALGACRPARRVPRQRAARAARELAAVAATPAR